MESFFCDTLDYYCINEQISKSFRYILRMKDDVDGDALRKALGTSYTLRLISSKLSKCSTLNSVSNNYGKKEF